MAPLPPDDHPPEVRTLPRRLQPRGRSAGSCRLRTEVGQASSILQMGGFRPKEEKPCAQGHTANMQQAELGLSPERALIWTP